MNKDKRNHEMRLLGTSVLLSVAVHAAVLGGFPGFKHDLPGASHSEVLQVQLLRAVSSPPVFAPRVAEAAHVPASLHRVQPVKPSLAAVPSAVSVAPQSPTVARDMELPPAAVAVAVKAAQPVTQPDFSAAYLDNPRPAYPLAARRMGLEGKVVIRAEVLESGSCSRLAVKDSSGYDVLDQAAMQAVKNWRFVPARRGSEAIVAWVEVPLVFKLGG